MVFGVLDYKLTAYFKFIWQYNKIKTFTNLTSKVPNVVHKCPYLPQTIKHYLLKINTWYKNAVKNPICTKIKSLLALKLKDKINYFFLSHH